MRRCTDFSQNTELTEGDNECHEDFVAERPVGGHAGVIRAAPVDEAGLMLLEFCTERRVIVVQDRRYIVGRRRRRD